MMLSRCIVAWFLVVLFSLPVPLFLEPDFDEDERIYASEISLSSRVERQAAKTNTVWLRTIDKSCFSSKQVTLGNYSKAHLSKAPDFGIQKKIGEQFWSFLSPAIKQARSLLWQMSRQVQKLLLQKKPRYFRKSLLLRVERIEAGMDSSNKGLS